MTIEKGQKYTRKHKTYIVIKVDSTIHFTYVTVLEDGLENTLKNCKVFGVVAFESEFKFIKEVKDG